MCPRTVRMLGNHVGLRVSSYRAVRMLVDHVIDTYLVPARHRRARVASVTAPGRIIGHNGHRR
eukprot:5739012-Prymnesium_polylepis.1